MTKNETKLFSAIYSNDVQTAQKAIKGSLFSGGANVNTFNPNGLLPLYIAAKMNNEELVKLLLDNKADPNTNNKDGDLPLFIAIRNKNLAIVKLLVEYGADVNKEYAMSKPVESAFTYGDKETINFLLSKGAKYKPQDYYLISAAEKGNIELFDLLVKSGAKYNPDSLGRTPLIVATENGHLDFIKHIFPFVNDINEEDSSNRTALTLALKNENKEVADFLLSKGAIGKIVKEKFKYISHSCGNELEKILSFLQKTLEVKPFMENALKHGFTFDKNNQTSPLGIFIESKKSVIMFSTNNMVIKSCGFGEKGGDKRANVTIVEPISDTEGKLTDTTIFDIIGLTK